LARGLPLGARLLLALLRGLAQQIELLLRGDGERRIREALDEALQRRKISRILDPVPLQRLFGRRFADRRRRLREGGELDPVLLLDGFDLRARQIGVEAARMRSEENLPG